MQILKRTQYGLRAMVYLAAAFGKENNIRSLKEISQKENISFDYLEKIISQLEKKGLVGAKKGAKGGYFLKRSPQKISVGEVISTLESTMSPVKCLAKEKSKRYKCPHRKSCKTLNVWKEIQDLLNSTLDSITLADLLK